MKKPSQPVAGKSKGKLVADCGSPDGLTFGSLFVPLPPEEVKRLRLSEKKSVEAVGQTDLAREEKAKEAGEEQVEAFSGEEEDEEEAEQEDEVVATSVLEEKFDSFRNALARRNLWIELQCLEQKEKEKEQPRRRPLTRAKNKLRLGNLGGKPLHITLSSDDDDDGVGSNGKVDSLNVAKEAVVPTEAVAVKEMLVNVDKVPSSLKKRKMGIKKRMIQEAGQEAVTACSKRMKGKALAESGKGREIEESANPADCLIKKRLIAETGKEALTACSKRKKDLEGSSKGGYIEEPSKEAPADCLISKKGKSKKGKSKKGKSKKGKSKKGKSTKGTSTWSIVTVPNTECGTDGVSEHWRFEEEPREYREEFEAAYGVNEDDPIADGYHQGCPTDGEVDDEEDEENQDAENQDVGGVLTSAVPDRADDENQDVEGRGNGDEELNSDSDYAPPLGDDETFSDPLRHHSDSDSSSDDELRSAHPDELLYEGKMFNKVQDFRDAVVMYKLYLCD